MGICCPIGALAEQDTVAILTMNARSDELTAPSVIEGSQAPTAEMPFWARDTFNSPCMVGASVKGDTTVSVP